LEETLPDEGSLSDDHSSNALVYLALAYREVLRAVGFDYLDVRRKLCDAFDQLIVERARMNVSIDTTYLTRYGRLSKYENENSDSVG